MMNLNINFLNESATVEQVKNLHVAINHEGTEMSIQLCKDDISRTEKQISNLEKAENKTADQKEKEREALNSKLDDLKEQLEKLKTDAAETLPVYTQVVSEMSVKNENHFDNDKDVVRTVLRILATWDNSKLVKYAIIPAFQSPELYNALEAIHVSSKASDDGALVMSNEVKEAYKKASAELETIIKKTFSLPFETPYTTKTRVKLTAEDKKLLNDCYVKGFTNKFSVDEKTGNVDFSKRQVNTLVKAKRNKKTGKVEYDYSGLAVTIANIVIKHYFK